MQCLAIRIYCNLVPFFSVRVTGEFELLAMRVSPASFWSRYFARKDYCNCSKTDKLNFDAVFSLASNRFHQVYVEKSETILQSSLRFKLRKASLSYSVVVLF